MSNTKTKILVISSALFLVLVGIGLYILFDRQGYGNEKQNKVISYNVKDYVEVIPVSYEEYDDVYTSIDISRVIIKNISGDEIAAFTEKQNEIISYIDDYYSDIKKEDYVASNSAATNIKTQINGTVLSIYYELDFDLDPGIFDDNEKKYIVTLNIDLATERVLTTDELLSKYNYTKEYISEKIFNEDVLVANGQVVIDKNTNISLTKDDIMRKKDIYVDGIILQFDNIMKVYIESNSLVIVYDSKELKGLFFDNNFETNIKMRYLK